MIMENMTPIFPLCLYLGGHRVGRSCDDMRNFYQQMFRSSDGRCRVGGHKVDSLDRKREREASHDDQNT